MEQENEYVAIARYPRLPLIVEGLEYPENIQALIDDVNLKFGLWAEAETDFVVAEQDLVEGKAKDAQAFKDSVLAGSKDPGFVHEPKAARHVERTRILMAARLKEVNRASGVLSAAYKEQGKEIVTSAIAMARAGVDAYEALVFEAARKLEQATETRWKSLGGLALASELTQSIYRFPPHFPAVNQAVLPETRQFRVTEICDQLETLIKKGALFPDPFE